MKKNRWKKGIALFLSIMAIFTGSMIPVQASEYWPQAPETASPCVMVMEMNTGAVLYEKNADEVHYPASITKIMTTLIAIEKGKMDDVVTFSADAVYKNEGDTSHISRDLEEQMTLEQCLYGVMLESANECAYAVAEHIGGGDVSKFVDMMNEKAKELGCTNTHFNNTNGLPDEQHYTSTRDMLLLPVPHMRMRNFVRLQVRRSMSFLRPISMKTKPHYIITTICSIRSVRQNISMMDVPEERPDIP